VGDANAEDLPINIPFNRCNKELLWENRGREAGRGAWEAHHRRSEGGDSLSNCEILCWVCHKATL